MMILFYIINMKLKHVVELTIIIAICLSNYMISTQYYSEYDPKHFSFNQILDKRYRCIRYFDEKDYDRYSHYSCKNYMHDYINFKLERSRYILMYYAHNLIMGSMLIIFHLVL